jgi:putative protease
VPRIYIDRLPIDSELLKKIGDAVKKNSTEFYLAFPYIVRKRSYGELEKLFSLLKLPAFDGVLVRNLETLAWLSDKKYGKKIVTDINLYAWNRYAYEFLKEKADEIYFPAELNVHDMKELTKSGALEEGEASVMVYGRLPMMVSAGCIRKTKEACSHTSGYDRITDRMQKQFPVYHDCTNCYNIMYNSVPLSGHKLFENRLFVPGKSRLDFTLESGAEAEKVIMYFQKLSEGDYEAPFYKEFTTGHLKRGVE